MPPRDFDWSEICRRLAAAEKAVTGDAEQAPEQARKVLEARARAAARPPARPEAGEQLELLAFTLAGEAYGVETRFVREVCQLRDLTAVPGTPSFMAGVVVLRGRLVAVVDLRKFFELPARGLTELNRIAVLADGASELGLLADSIEGVRSVGAARLQAPLSALGGIRETFLKGVTGQMMAVLDGARLLGDAALKVNSQVNR